MQFRVDTAFKHKREEPRFYVRPLRSDDTGYACGYRWQIQLLNEDEQGEAALEFGPDDPPEVFSILNVDLPQAVVDAAKAGIADYVDAAGRPREPGFLGGRVKNEPH